MMLIRIDMCAPGAHEWGRRMVKRIESRLARGGIDQSKRDELEALRDEISQAIRRYEQ